MCYYNGVERQGHKNWDKKKGNGERYEENRSKKLIKNYLKDTLDLKIVNINNKYDFWLAVDITSNPYEIFVDYQENNFSVTRLSTTILCKTIYYKYDEFENIRII